MSDINVDEFDDFFYAVHGVAAYPWQRRLAELAVAGRWPAAIDLPTGSGKTACIDIGIFAMACQSSLPPESRSAARRIFFCVNRRVIVSEAFERARHIALAIWNGERSKGSNDILARVAANLRMLSGDVASTNTPPIDALEVRGGIFRDNRWTRSITQPTVICTTLDQLGSRLLFRGYGVSSGAAPVQAALIAYDSLIMLDEAHISEPFRQTLENVGRYLDPERWGDVSLGIKPFVFVPMTATPTEAMRSKGVITLNDRDREVVALSKRLQAVKRTELLETKDLTKDVLAKVKGIVASGPKAIGIIVNRVVTARKIHSEIQAWIKEQSLKINSSISLDTPVELVIGSMRPIDRDQQAIRLADVVGGKRPKPESRVTSIVVATQCLEVGADYDFDVLITECASLDALRQRFGRLNRSGREIDAAGIVFIQTKDVKPEEKLDPLKPADPLYGNALARTWNLLQQVAQNQVVDFGVDSFTSVLDELAFKQMPKEFLSPSASLEAPAILPAYLDLWCQTSPSPALSPNVGVFIHGSAESEPDVQVCWRADLAETESLSRDQWGDVVALLPPTAAECVRIPISRMRRWLQGVSVPSSDDSGDVMGIVADVSDRPLKSLDRQPTTQSDLRVALAWRGSGGEAPIVTQSNQVQPGDTYVIPTGCLSSLELAYLPGIEANCNKIVDLAEASFLQSKNRAALRLHPIFKANLPALLNELITQVDSDDPPTKQHWAEALGQAVKSKGSDTDAISEAIKYLSEGSFTVSPYPDGKGVVLLSSSLTDRRTDWYVPAVDDGYDDASKQEPVYLSDHYRHVAEVVDLAVELLPIAKHRRVFKCAAMIHDLGKSDDRFQAMLRGTDRTDSWLVAWVRHDLIAKSFGIAALANTSQGRARSGLPSGFRHEMLSLQLAMEFPRELGVPEDREQRELMLHLVSSHHGYGRPFAPVVIDEEMPELAFEFDSKELYVSSMTRSAWVPTYRLDSGVAERFWILTRRFGWWGLAYLESVLRLSDQQASAAESEGKNHSRAKRGPLEVPS